MKLKSRLIPLVCSVSTFLFPFCASAEISLLFTATSAHVSTQAGGDDKIGVQEAPVDGRVRNSTGVNVPDIGLKINGGSALSNLDVSSIPGVNMSAFMQAQASALPESGEASSEASVTFAFTKPTQVIVTITFRQGGTFFSIDGVEEQVVSGSSANQFELPAGQHKFQIASRSKSDPKVSNPNFSIQLDAAELQGEIGTEIPNVDQPNAANLSAAASVNTMKGIVGSLQFPRNKKAQKAYKGQLNALLSAESEFRTFTKANGAGITIKGNASLKVLTNKLRAALLALSRATTKKAFTVARSHVSAALDALTAALA